MATLTLSEEKRLTDDIVDRGEAIYQAEIRQELETDENIGKLLMIDVESGEWVMGTDRIEMARRAREKNPGARLYGIRIGYPATTAIGGNLRSFREIALDEAEQDTLLSVSSPVMIAQ